MKKTIDVDALLKWAQPHLRMGSPFLYPNPQPALEVYAKEFWEWVMSQTDMTPDQLNEKLDELFPQEEET
jgi:hypothetical protein